MDRADSAGRGGIRAGFHARGTGRPGHVRDAVVARGAAAGTSQVRDASRRRDVGTAMGCAALLTGLLLLVDTVADGLSPAHAGAWFGLGVLLFVVLLPRRVLAGPGWVSSRGLLRERRVRTDRLVSLRWSGEVAQRLVLRDTDGGWVELDPRTLPSTPQVWHQLEEDALGSLARGTLCQGGETLRCLAAYLDGEITRSVLGVSGLR